MDIQHLTVIDIAKEAKEKNNFQEAYRNITVATVNDHVVKMSVMTEPYFWHFHPDSDEIFFVVEGSLMIDLPDKTVELFPNQLLPSLKISRIERDPMGTDQ